MRYPQASTEPLEVIRANECDAAGGLATGRFQALWNEIERLQARIDAKPTPEAILLQARKPDGGEWVDIFPAQLSWLAKEGNEVRALEGADEQQEDRNG